MVRQDDGAIVVDAMDPESVMSVVESPGVGEVAAEVKKRLSSVVDAV